MSKISIPSPKVSNTSDVKKRPPRVKKVPVAGSKKSPAVASEAKQSTPLQKRPVQAKQPKQPTPPQQAKQVKATPPAASKKAPVVKGGVKQAAPSQQKSKKSKQTKQPKQPTVPQQAKQVNPAPPKAPAKATPAAVAVPKISDVPKLKMPPAAKKQPSPVKSAPPAASKKAPVVKAEAKQSAPAQQKGKKSKKTKQPKQPTVSQQTKQANPALPKAPAKATPVPVAVPKIVNVPNKTSLEGLDELDLGFMPLDQLQEKLKQLIQEVLADPSHESFMLYFSFNKSDWEAFFNWYKAFGREFSYPHSVTLAPYPKEFLPETLEEDRIYKALKLTNYTKRENDAKIFPRRVFGGQFDEELINSDTLNNLLARSGLQPEDFEKGKHGFTEKVFCKSIQLEHDESVEAAQNELRAKIDEELVKVGKKTKTRDINYQYVVLVFQLPKRDDLPFNQIEVHDVKNPNYARENSIIGQIDHNSERRIYVCLKNEARLVIDLHQHSVPEALDKVEDFVRTKWERYEESCEIITGAGIHSAVMGESLLQQRIKPWLESRKMSMYVDGIEPLIGNTKKNPLVYAFRIFLKPPKLCDLTQLSPDQSLEEALIAVIKEATLDGEKRIRFVANNINSLWPSLSSAIYPILSTEGATMSFDFHGEKEFRIKIQEPSDESESTEDVSE